MSVNDGGIVIDFSKLRSVRVNPATRRVQVQPGATLGDVDHETQSFNLAVPTGTVSETGIAGLTLWGGFGHLRRQYGLTLDNLRAVDIVTAEGELTHAESEQHADLFWAVRGGGGHFGIIVNFEYEAQPVGPLVYGINIIYPGSALPAILQVFEKNYDVDPDALSYGVAVVTVPPMPPFPEPLHGQTVCIVNGAYNGPLEDGPRVVASLANIGTPIVNLSGPIPFKVLQSSIDEMAGSGKWCTGGSMFVDKVDDSLIAILERQLAMRPTPGTIVQVMPIGGAVNRVKSAETAFVVRSARHLVLFDATSYDEAEFSACQAWVGNFMEDLSQYVEQVHVYANLLWTESPDDKRILGSYGDNLDRLKSVKQQYDPTGLFSRVYLD